MKILFITHLSEKTFMLNDFMHDIVFHGLKEIYNDDVVDYPGVWYMYRDEVEKKKYDIKNLWGNGFTLYNLLHNYEQIDRTDIKNKIKKNYFDIVVYGSIRRSTLFLEEATSSNSKIIFIDGEDDSNINENIINKGTYFKRELISKKYNNVYPISFAVPKAKIISILNPKPKNLLAPLIPGRKSTYMYQNEQDYYQMYQNSIFALTFQKGGWDSLRHYEILMNGCIPLFLDIHKCPETILTNLPKDLLSDIFRKYSFVLNQFFPTKIYKKKFLTIEKFFLYFFNIFKKKHTSESLINKYSELIEVKKQLIDYTRKNLTTENIATNIISNTLKKYL